MITLFEVLRMPKDKLIELIQSNPNCITYEHAWIWYRGNLPTLVAHIDTVYDNNKEWNNRTIITSQGYYWSPDGIGADDRAGVYAVMKLYNEIECNCIFTDGEESGGIGAREITINAKELLKEVPYFIQIDRKGNNQAVFYNNEDGEFVTIVTKHFKQETGTFSDISIIGRDFLIASANLSAGYYHEHQGSGEYLYEPHLTNTIEKVPILIEDLGDTQYKIKPVYDYWRYNWRYDDYYWKDDYNIAELYESLLSYSEYTPINELVYEYSGVVSLGELEKLKKYFSNKDFKKLKKIVKKIEDAERIAWKRDIDYWE